MVSVVTVVAFLAVFVWYGMTLREYDRRAGFTLLLWIIALAGFNVFWITLM